jgi:hypothetical protein
MNKRERIKTALKVAFATGFIAGSISFGIFGYNVGAGNIELPEIEFHLPENNPCYPRECTHYSREIIGGAMIYEKDCCCGTHGHDCPSY